MGKTAFNGPRINGFMLDPDELVIVGIDVEEKDEDGNLHFLYDERVDLPLAEEFVKNVKVLGVKKNIIVTKIDGKGYVVDGRQRVRAARAANARLEAEGEPTMRVPIVQQKGEEPLIMSVAFATNEFNTEDSQLTRARKAQRLRDRGLTDEEIANIFGVSTKAISNWEKLLGLAAPVKKAVQKGKISASAAAQLSDLPAAEQKTQLKDLVDKAAQNGGKPPTIKQAKTAAKKAKGQSPNQAPSKKVLRFIVEQKEQHAAPLSDDFIAGIAFAIGLQDAKTINGLSGVVQAALAKPKKKKAPAKPKVAKKKGASKKTTSKGEASA
jgi:ParB family transcriptional regulator, chromosome partitioning protein